MRSRVQRGPVRATVLAWPLAALILLALGAASCSKKPTKPTPIPPLGLGTAVVDTALVSVGSELAWSGATGEICYIEDFTFELNGVHADSRVRRRIDGAADQINLTGLVPAPLGGQQYSRWVYYRLIDDDLNIVVVRRDLRGVQRDTLATNVRDFVVSGDTLLAYTTYQDGSAQDSLYLLRPATGERTLIAFGRPRAFSPDGRQLLYREPNGQPSDTRVIDLQSFAITPMPLGLPAGSFSYGPRWTAQGIRALYRLDSPSRVVLRNVTLGTDEVLFTSTTDSLDTAFPKWSHDGRKIAFVTHKFTSILGGADYERQASVWSVDVASRTATLVARGLNLPASQNFGVIFEYAEFSPDDRALAYVVRGRLYKSTIP